jgi:hypothetical protein
MTCKTIRHNPSRFVTVLGLESTKIDQNGSNPSQSVTCFCDGSVTDFGGEKAHKYKEKLSLYLNPSRCHAHPRAMRTHACGGGVTDFRDGLGTPGQKSLGEAIGNERKARDSFFSRSKLQSPKSIPMFRNCNRVSQMYCTFKTPLTTSSLRNSKIGSLPSWGSHFFTCRFA